MPGRGNAERGPTSPPPCHPPGFRSGLSGQWPRALGKGGGVPLTRGDRARGRKAGFAGPEGAAEWPPA